MANKSTWNYRLLAYERNDEVIYCLHEVHYKNGKPTVYSERPALILGETVIETLEVTSMMLEAITKTLSGEYPIYYGDKNFPEIYAKKR